MNTIVKWFLALILAGPIVLFAQSSDPEPAQDEALASGLGINLPLVARLTGAGATLYTSSVDVANNTANPTQVDFYLDGIDIASSTPISKTGSISSTGTIAGQGAGGLMRARSNAHFDDFVQSLINAGILPGNIA